MNIEIKKVWLNDIKLNPDNPRQINAENLKKLTKSIKEFPEMLKMREIVVDENMMILGGNMRYRALKDQGIDDCTVKIVTGLTDAQKREFIIKDNNAFGEYDWDSLANEWSDLPLDEWGVDIPESWLDNINEIEPPELNSSEKAPFQQITFTLHDEQAELVQNALSIAKEKGASVSPVNENSNGNAIAYIAQVFIDG